MKNFLYSDYNFVKIDQSLGKQKHMQKWNERWAKDDVLGQRAELRHDPQISSHVQSLYKLKMHFLRNAL